MRTGKAPLSTTDARESITTERLVLRPLQEADAEAIFAYNEAHPEVRRYSLVRHVSRSYAQQFARWASGATRPAHKLPIAYYFAICPKETGSVAGFCGFWVTDGSARTTAQMGYELSSDFWGQGYMTEAARALITYAFTQVGVHRVTANCFKANIASIRVLEKAGMQQSPVRFQDRLVFWMSWNFRPIVSYVVTYAMTREEWQTPKAIQ